MLLVLVKPVSGGKKDHNSKKHTVVPGPSVFCKYNKVLVLLPSNRLFLVLRARHCVLRIENLGVNFLYHIVPIVH